MGRAWRIEYEGALYHILSRGNEQKDIFYDDQDRLLFLDTIGEMSERFEIDVFAYVLMGNPQRRQVASCFGDCIQAGARQMVKWFHKEDVMRKRQHKKLVHEVQYVAEVEIEEWAHALVVSGLGLCFVPWPENFKDPDFEVRNLTGILPQTLPERVVGLSVKPGSQEKVKSLLPFLLSEVDS